MLTLNIDCDVLQDRRVTIQLPETVSLGRHELIIVLDENNTDKNSAVANAKTIMEFANTVAAFERVDGVEYQQRARAEWN